MSASPPLPTRPLGSTGIEVTTVCLGTSPLSSMSRLYGYEVEERRAVDTVLAAFDRGIGFIDTSNGYGEDGSAERRIGAAVRERGGLPDGTVLATKVDPDPATGDFSGERVRVSYAESRERLGVDRVPLLYLHDPERIPIEDGLADAGPFRALVRLREEGGVDRIGIAGGPIDVLRRYLDTGEVDVLLSHNRYTLLDRSARELYEEAHASGVGIANAAPYGGGMLAKGPEAHGTYAYGERDAAIATAAAAMQAACARSGVPLPAAALQFSLRAPFVDTTVVGMSSPDRVAQTLDYARMEIPGELWDELEELVPPSETWLR